MIGSPSVRLTLQGIRLAGDGGPASEASIANGSLQLRGGTITVLVGANGSGKTRFMEMVAGLRPPEGMAVSFGDAALRQGTRRSLRRGGKLNPKALLAYAYSCQSPEEQLFMRSVEEELRYSLRPYALPQPELGRRISAALAAVNWDASWLGRDPYAMSGGERRRTALACLFAPPASWLLLDEPTAGLDAEGHALLGDKLRRCADEGQGVLLISHESDWAFELADRILLMHPDGSLRSCDKSELLANPNWLAEAGMDMPDWFGIAALSARFGVSSEAVWNPVELAEAIAVLSPQERPLAFTSTAASCVRINGVSDQQRRLAGTSAAASDVPLEGRSNKERPIVDITTAASDMPSVGPSSKERATAETTTAASDVPSVGLSSKERPPANTSTATESVTMMTGTASTRMPESRTAASPVPVRTPFALRAGASRPSPIARFDARAVWLTYILLSTAILQLSGWPTIGIAAIMVAAAIGFGRIPLRRWRGAINAIATFTVAISLFAGFGHGGDGDGFWDGSASLASLESLARPLLVMLLGFGLPVAVTPLRLRRSLEQLFVRFGRIPLWGTKLLLIITLLLRFVPVLLAEWERFARIAAARGKQPGSAWRGGIRRIRETALPFMLSLFRLGDGVTDALESRGVGAQAHPTVLVTEVWKPRDTLLVIAGAAAVALLWL
ncbi:ATP-binding cassette domain-containing protein [Paenibacillus glycinis]|uniref:ATP-binding cassette domain-containing protein n=1 Tax=Paenibacillus glycinis TaxID=2697035 RepID=A0ABW9XL87_9BACL|nr:ATP-binding cassette domain-containing protein [Paenibacillus glycinis]NBD23377.1 ATP-binding cassette domain-containing protein [Paenibacillus glycinis]